MKVLMKSGFLLWVLFWSATRASASASASARGRKTREAVLSSGRRESESVNPNDSDPPSMPAYYDELRTRAVDETDSSVKATLAGNDTESHVIDFAVSENENEVVYRLADVTVLLPFTDASRVTESSRSTSGKSSLSSDDVGKDRSSVHNDAAALMLAMYHFNNGLLSAVLRNPDDVNNQDDRGLRMDSCNVRMTARGGMADTKFSPIESTRLLTDVLYSNHRPDTPLPVAIVGAYRSACTSPIAILSGVNHICEITYHSSSTDFDNTEQYPLLGRTVPSSAGDARAAVDYLVKLGVKHVGVVFVTDAFGSAYQKAFQDAAGELDDSIQTDSVSFSYGSGSTKEIENAVRSLKDTDFRYFLAIVGDEHYAELMTEAAKQGITGPDFFWLFTSGIDRATFQANARFPPGSNLTNATHGIAIIQVEGGQTNETLYADPQPDTSNDNAQSTLPNTGYHRFRKAWTDAISNDVLIQYFRSKLPNRFRDLPFSSQPSQHAYFIYDAVAALGLSMCRLQSYFFVGEEVFDNFTQAPVEYEGASGILNIDDMTGSRQYESVVYTIWNARQSQTTNNNDGDETLVAFDLVPTAHYIKTTANLSSSSSSSRPSSSRSSWVDIPGNDFVFNDNAELLPPSLPPVADKNYNLIGMTGRFVGITLMLLVMALSVSSILWTFWKWRSHVVRASQPLFLIFISVGCFVMSMAIVPLSQETKDECNDDNDNEEIAMMRRMEGLDYDSTECDQHDFACMSAPWFYAMGFAIAFAALFAKTWNTNKVFHNPELDKIMVKPLDLLKMLVLLCSVNVSLLLAWTYVSPLEWGRINKDSKDKFDRPTESYGICDSDHARAFGVTIIAANLILLLFANWEAYQAREIQTEYQESRYVAISMASILQAWCMGIPIMIVVWESPQAKFFVEAGIIFVTCTAVLLLIFIPKILAVRMDIRKEKEKKRRDMMKNIGARRNHGGGSGEFEDDDDDEEEEEEEEDEIQSSTRADPGHSSTASYSYGNSQERTGSTNTTSGQSTDVAHSSPRVSATRDDDEDAIPEDTFVDSPSQRVTMTTDAEQPRIKNPNEAPDAIHEEVKEEEEDDNEGIRVVRNPAAERKKTSNIRNMLNEAQMENMRLHNENAAYEEELEVLRNSLGGFQRGPGMDDNDDGQR